MQFSSILSISQLPAAVFIKQTFPSFSCRFSRLPVRKVRRAGAGDSHFRGPQTARPRERHDIQHHDQRVSSRWENFQAVAVLEEGSARKLKFDNRAFSTLFGCVRRRWRGGGWQARVSNRIGQPCPSAHRVLQFAADHVCAVRRVFTRKELFAKIEAAGIANVVSLQRDDRRAGARWQDDGAMSCWTRAPRTRCSGTTALLRAAGGVRRGGALDMASACTRLRSQHNVAQGVRVLCNRCWTCMRGAASWSKPRRIRRS